MRWSEGEAVYVAPALLLNPILYWHGYHAWFQQDDFAWLGLLQMLGSAGDLPRLLFEPMAQGTIRPVSERLFFLVFRRLFDLEGGPYHALVLATQTLNLVLLYTLVRQLGGGRGRAGLTAVIWCSSAVLAWPLSWVSAYNQILLASCLLGGANAFVRFAATDERRFLAIAWAVYLFGFGVLESNVVFPGLALLFSALSARPLVKHALWMLTPAAVFSAVHAAITAKAHDGVYAMSYETGSVIRTLLRYGYRSVWPGEVRQFLAIADAQMIWSAAAAATLAAWVLFWRRDRLAAFGAGWFLICVSLYLLIPNHVCDYYLTTPALGFAMVLAAALASIPRFAAVALLVVYLPLQWSGTWQFTGRARRISSEWEEVMAGVERVAQRHPGKSIFLQGIDTETLSSGWTDQPFRLIGVSDVKLAPEDAAGLARRLGQSGEQFTTPASVLLRALDLDEAVVYRFEPGECIREVSGGYAKKLLAGTAAFTTPNRIAVGERAYSFLLGPGWFEPERGFRWMGQRAEFEIGPAGGQSHPQRLHIRGFCAPAQLSQGPLRLTIEAGEATPAVSFTIDTCGAQFDLAAPLAPVKAGKERISVKLMVNRTQVFAPDTRAIGLAVTTVEVR